MRMKRAVMVGLVVIVLAPAAVLGQWPLPDSTPPQATSTSTIALGLREALTVGAENAVTRTGRLDGFLQNEAIKILLPEKLRRVETALRYVGYGPKVDEFIVAMNRAAERAAASSKPIFLDAIRGITIDDARGILTGGETAATEYFRERTQEGLTTAFRPIVTDATNASGVTRQYKDLVKGLPIGNAQGLDIDEYVVAKTLDGLFYVLGEEERKIRKDPAARITAILRDVFGR